MCNYSERICESVVHIYVTSSRVLVHLLLYMKLHNYVKVDF